LNRQRLQHHRYRQHLLCRQFLDYLHFLVFRIDLKVLHYHEFHLDRPDQQRLGFQQFLDYL
jgi:hypothetical protein